MLGGAKHVGGGARMKLGGGSDRLISYVLCYIMQ